MAKFVISLLLVLFSASLCAAQEDTEYCSGWPSLLRRPCQRINQIWYQGNIDLLFSGYAWHNRYTYRPEKIKTYNEKAIGGGVGKSFFDEDGDLHGLYTIVFSDSHRNLEPCIGYAFLKNWPLTPSSNLGLGFSALVTARPDINKGNPFPGALPVASLQIKKATFFATYIPGAAGAGNVLFLFGKWQLTDW